MKLDDSSSFKLIHSFRLPRVLTWGDKDPEKREIIRDCASQRFKKPTFIYEWCGFRILVKRNRHARNIDIENVPKLIVDSFSGAILSKDNSKYKDLELYPDDDLRYVRIVHAEGPN